MKNEKIKNLVENTNIVPSTFRRKSWIEIIHDTHETYNKNSKLQCWTQAYVVAVMLLYLLKLQ